MTGNRPCSSRRHNSLSRRRRRLRATAVCRNRGTISPKRPWPTRPGAQMMSKCSRRARRPAVITRRMSLPRTSLRERGMRSSWLRRGRASSRSPRSGACDPSCDDATVRPDPSVGHPLAEPVFCYTPLVARPIRWHHLTLPLKKLAGEVTKCSPLRSRV
jgi:hypothetical protein